MTIEDFISGFLGASALEMTASVCGFICVFLIIKRNIWCFFFGLIQVTLFAYIFFNIKLYSNAGLHVVFMGLQIYGWWNWTHHRDNQEQLIVEAGTPKLAGLSAAVALLSALALGTYMDRYTDASFAYLDAFITCASLVAQVLLTKRYMFNWLFWMVVNVVAIYVYLQKGLYPTSLLYVTFLVMCVFGYYSWWKQYKLQQEVT